MNSEVVGTNLTTNLTAGAPTEATNLTEDASQNEIQQLNMTNYLDGKCLASVIKRFILQKWWLFKVVKLSVQVLKWLNVMYWFDFQQ